MKEKNNLYLYIIGGVFLGAVFIYLARKKQQKNPMNNYDSLLANEPKARVVGDFAKLDLGDGTSASFYQNNRFYIFNAKKEWLKKGTYTNGGRKVVTDDGKTAEGNDVVSNMLKVKK